MTMLKHSMRIERDSLGTVEVPSDALYGAQTARALSNFNAAGIPIGHFPNLIRGLALVKKAAARSNHRIGILPENLTLAIEGACDEIIVGQHMEAFVVDVLQGGAGTSSNMNMNEVVANLAADKLGQPRGCYDVIHPIDHVNLSQSTNDAYPTAIRIAVLTGNAYLREALGLLVGELEERAHDFAVIRKLGRTQLQDAVSMTAGQEFRAFASTLREGIARLAEIGALLNEVNLGGNAIGTGVNAPAGYRTMIVDELAAISGLPVTSAVDLVEASWDTGGLVLFSGMLRRTVTKLSKIANDFRLLSSGPRGGVGEISLPPMQPGSSIMPGEINPVIPEMINQIEFQVIGADLVVTLASEAGQLQLNAMEPVMAYNILTSIELLTRGCRALAEKCVRGIQVNAAVCALHLDRSTAMAAELVPYLGYGKAAEIAQRALSSGRSLAEISAVGADVRHG